ncbi:class I SAM-dependent methyltransferase [Actinomadura kijaniata]|uniref:class I SAM-dependent methyltransferase n=1 Tax=Actinomadura kijaniata TaxID=46161 RepID=UPI000833450D|nr:class I SAM-dependent methyltransferase [Actinomadura kijaniata]
MASQPHGHQNLHHGHAHHGHAHHGHAHHGHGPADDSGLAEMLDLDAEVLHPLLAETTGRLAESAGDRPPRRILDLGSGTGAGTVALLRRFPDAEVIAVDAATSMLERLRHKAQDLGMADRVTTVQADLDDAWPPVGTVDLVWASASVHHLADPVRVLREVFAALRPGGLLAVLELDAFPRFLPDDLGLGRSGLEARCHAALAERREQQGPRLDIDWGPYLTEAGFALEDRRVLSFEQASPPPAAGRYARALLRKFRSHLDDRLAPDDLATLDALLDDEGPHSVLRRTDLTVRATRTVWTAARP